MQLYRQASASGLELTGFGRPMGLGFDSEKRLLVTDMDCHVLLRLDSGLEAFQIHPGPGHRWSEWHKLKPGRARTRPKQSPGGFNGPHSVQEDAAGRLLVTCYYAPQIAALAPDGTIQTLAGPELLKGPATTRMDSSSGRLLVAEYALNLVLVLDRSGACIGHLGHDPAHGSLRPAPGSQGVPASAQAGAFDRLHMAIAAPNGSLLVADTWNHRLQRFRPDGHHEACLDDYDGWHAGASPVVSPRLLNCPVALDLDPHGRLLVTCWGSNEVLLLGANGVPQPLPMPLALSKPYDARFMRSGIVVADTHNGRVLVVDNCFSPIVPAPRPLQ